MHVATSFNNVIALVILVFFVVWSDGDGLPIKPFVFEPSGKWDGPDGPWASFSMNVRGREGDGTNFRIFPATSFSVFLLPVAADFCNGSHVLEEPCASRNVIGFNSSAMISAYAGDKSVLPALGLSRFMAGDTWATEAQPFGLTNVGINSTSTESVTVTTQWVLGMASKTFPGGLFGLSNTKLKFYSVTTRPFIETFRTVASLNATALGFSYTAGSYKRNLVPSLVLGGYDSTRFDPRTTLEVDIARSTTSPLSVNLTALSFSGSDKVWRDGGVDSLGSVTVNIDSAIPHIWLPLSACKVFEDVFSLEWNETAQLYLINATAHDRLQRLNTSVTFSLHSSRYGSKARDFVVPYTAFDMRVTYPLVETESYYFPLKRASSPDQYTLGRTFLQETHISVNYETVSFNISQAAYTDGDIVLQPFLPPAPTPVNTGTSPKASTTSKLSPGAYAALASGIGSLILVVAIVILAWKRKQWPFKKPSPAHNTENEHVQYSKGELDGLPVVLVEAMERERAELEAKEPVVEINSPNTPTGYYSSWNNLHELDADNSPRTSIQKMTHEDIRITRESQVCQKRFEEVKLTQT